MTDKSDHTEQPESGLTPLVDINPRSDTPLDFKDADFGQLSPDDYAVLGFMSGLEVHQQLDTKSKLFCRCPAGRTLQKVDAEVLRHMRPTLSELGEYDGTALMEFKTRKEIVYQLERASVCTYEIDDTPPFEIDDEAVRGAIEVADLLNLNLVSELHVMRKQYLDGSIPTGFQRTAMIGLTGEIPFRVPELGIDRPLRIRQLSLEEDSCREVSDLGHRIVFRTDRLGTPLTEAVTEPDLLTPLELQAAARLLARVAHATGRVRRGPGAARQDVNVSIAGGRRVEIKGVDNHRRLPQLVHVEAYRQLNLLRIKDELARRGVTKNMLRLPTTGLPWESSDLAIDAGSLLRNCNFAPIHQADDRGHRICALKLPGFGGLLSHRTQPGVTFAREFADRLRVIACLEDRPFATHSDLSDFGLDSHQWHALGRQLKADNGDAMVVLWGPEKDAETAVREIFLRAADALDGVPAETRQAFSDGTNGFERILPGADRMYPDTDTPPLPISDDVVVEVRARGREAPWIREERYVELGLNVSEARHLADSEWADLFDDLAPGEGKVARRLARTFAKRMPHYRRSGFIDALPEATVVAPLVEALAGDHIRLEATDRILDTIVLNGVASIEQLLEPHRRSDRDEAAFETRLLEVVAAAASMEGRSAETLTHWGMGQLMKEFLGKLDPVMVEQRLREALGTPRSERTS